MFRKRREIQGHAGAIYSCAFDGTYIYSASADKFVARWIPEEGVQDKFAIRFEHSVYATTTFEQLLFVGRSDGGLHIFNLETRVEEKYFTQHTKAVFSTVVNPVKRQFYAGDADGNLSIWDIDARALMLYLPLDCGKIRDIHVSGDGSVFVVCAQDGTVRIFDTDHFNEQITLNAHKDGATAACFPDGSSDVLVTGGKDAMLRIWDLKAQTCFREVPAHNFAIYRIIRVGNELVSVSRDKTVKIWSQELDFRQRLDQKAGGHRHSVNDAVALSDESFASCGDDKRIILWERTSD